MPSHHASRLRVLNSAASFCLNSGQRLRSFCKVASSGSAMPHFSSSQA